MLSYVCEAFLLGSQHAMELKGIEQATSTRTSSGGGAFTYKGEANCADDGIDLKSILCQGTSCLLTSPDALQLMLRSQSVPHLHVQCALTSQAKHPGGSVPPLCTSPNAVQWKVWIEDILCSYGLLTLTYPARSTSMLRLSLISGMCGKQRVLT